MSRGVRDWGCCGTVEVALAKIEVVGRCADTAEVAGSIASVTICHTGDTGP